MLERVQKTGYLTHMYSTCVLSQLLYTVPWTLTLMTPRYKARSKALHTTGCGPPDKNNQDKRKTKSIYCLEAKCISEIKSEGYQISVIFNTAFG